MSVADVESADSADRVDHVVELLARWSLGASVGSGDLTEEIPV